MLAYSCPTALLARRCTTVRTSAAVLAIGATEQVLHPVLACPIFVRALHTRGIHGRVFLVILVTRRLVVDLPTEVASRDRRHRCRARAADGAVAANILKKNLTIRVEKFQQFNWQTGQRCPVVIARVSPPPPPTRRRRRRDGSHRRRARDPLTNIPGPRQARQVDRQADGMPLHRRLGRRRVRDAGILRHTGESLIYLYQFPQLPYAQLEY